VQSQWLRRSTLKKHNNSGKKSEPTSKPTKSRGPVQRDTKEVLAELVGKLKEKLDAKKVAATSAGEKLQSGELRPNLDRLTVGVDLGDQWSHYCILGLEGETLAEGQLRTTQQHITEFFQALNAARVVFEVGTHSPWVREVICGCGHEVLVANPRLMEGSKRRKRKNDRIDANKLARLGRVDPQSLHPMQHRSREVRQDLLVLRARDALVAARTELINATRGLVKSMGSRLPKCSSPSFAQKVEETVPVEIREALLPLVRMAATLSDCIQGYDEKIEKLGREKYGHTALLRQVKGVGPITALAYVLTLENPDRFVKSRDVGPYLGLVPKQEDFRGEPATIRNQQSRGHDAAPAAGRKRALYLGAVRTGHGLTPVWAAALRAGWEECEEESGGSGGAEARRLTALPLGEWRSI
jgi:transposase